MLAIFKEINADDNLFSMIFGESILNDAVSIVMYRTIVGGQHEDYSYSKHVIVSFYNFLVVLVGSILIGALLALCVSLVSQRAPLTRSRLGPRVDFQAPDRDGAQVRARRDHRDGHVP